MQILKTSLLADTRVITVTSMLPLYAADKGSNILSACIDAITIENKIVPEDKIIYEVVAIDQTRQCIYENGAFKICNIFTCDCCKQAKYYVSDFTTGYGKDKDGSKMRYECIAKDELAKLIAAPVGYFKETTLYFCDDIDKPYRTIQNWPGSLSFQIYQYTKGYHNIAGVQHNFGFMVFDEATQKKHYFHGRVCGNNTQIASIRKLK